MHKQLPSDVIAAFIALLNLFLTVFVALLIFMLYFIIFYRSVAFGGFLFLFLAGRAK